MRLKDSADRLAVRLRETVEQFSQQELGRAYSHEDFVRQASVSLDLIASECLMFGADVFDEEQDAPTAPSKNVVSLAGGRDTRSVSVGRAEASERSGAEIVAEYRARWAVSRRKVARTRGEDAMQSHPMFAAIIMVSAAVIINAALEGSISRLAMVLVLSLAVGLSGFVAGIAGLMSAATLAIACHYVFLQSVLDWPIGCSAKCILLLALAAAAISVFIKRRELKTVFSRRVPT